MNKLWQLIKVSCHLKSPKGVNYKQLVTPARFWLFSLDISNFFSRHKNHAMHNMLWCEKGYDGWREKQCMQNKHRSMKCRSSTNGEVFLIKGEGQRINEKFELLSCALSSKWSEVMHFAVRSARFLCKNLSPIS